VATRKAGITAIKRVIEDELRKRIAKENEDRKANWKEIGEAILCWALKHSPLGSVNLKGVGTEVRHEFLPTRSSSYCGYTRPEVVKVVLANNGIDGITGSLEHEMKLPAALLHAVNRNKEITFNSFQSEAELLASRVLLRAEDGDLEAIIADVVNDFVKEKTKE